MRCFRIYDSRFPSLDGKGALLRGGRWNSPGQSVAYAAETYAGAILEILVRLNFQRFPSELSVITIEIPASIQTETLEPSEFPEWQSQAASRPFGDRWLAELRTVALLVPSILTQGRAYNLLINSSHPDFEAITHTAPEPALWDERLFQQ